MFYFLQNVQPKALTKKPSAQEIAVTPTKKRPASAQLTPEKETVASARPKFMAKGCKPSTKTFTKATAADSAWHSLPVMTVRITNATGVNERSYICGKVGKPSRGADPDFDYDKLRLIVEFVGGVCFLYTYGVHRWIQNGQSNLNSFPNPHTYPIAPKHPSTGLKNPLPRITKRSSSASPKKSAQTKSQRVKPWR